MNDAVNGSVAPWTEPRSLTICGSGNAAHALAVVASANFEGHIDWLAGSAGKADLLRRGLNSGVLRATGAVEGETRRIRTVSADPAEVIPRADLVLILVPAFAHAAVLGRISPYLRPSTAVGCIPTRGGFEFEAAALTGDDDGRPAIFGLQTCPWSTRVKTVGQLVHIGAVKQEVVLAALPADRGPRFARLMSTILGTRVRAAESFLCLTLGNPGQFIHTGLMYGHFCSWRGDEYDEQTIPLLYAQASDATGELVGRLSAEAIAVASAIEAQSAGALKLRLAVPPIHDWLVKAYGPVTADASTVASCFRTGPIQARKAPMTEVRPGSFVPDFAYRYLSEDVPYGLVATRALADLAGVGTPAIDEVIHWSQAVLEKTYLVGETLDGPDARGLPLPQNYGVRDLSELVAWYRDHHAVAEQIVADQRADPPPLAVS